MLRWLLTLLGTLFALIYAPSLVASNFLVAKNFSAGNLPEAIASGDFDGDGNFDLAITNDFPAAVQILLGNGDGTFRQGVSLPVERPLPIAVADLNGDHKDDLIVGIYGDPGGISVLLGNGDGTFQPPVSYSATGYAEGIEIADFNGDGNLDVATAVFYGTVSVFLGNGDGTFQSAMNLGTRLSPASIAAGDMNGDGKLDLVVPVITGIGDGIGVLLGNGDGTFQPVTVSLTSADPSQVVLADVNRDGRLDVVASDVAPYGFSVFYGNGDGTITEGTTYLSSGNFTVGVATLDLNHDGNIDTLLANSSGATIYLGAGDGTFLLDATFGAGVLPEYLTLNDFNHDQSLDLAITNHNSNNVTVMLGVPNGTFESAETFPLGDAADGVAVGDLNHDGKIDVLAATCNTVAELLGNGNGTFAPAIQITSPAPQCLQSVAVADFNNDGTLDMVIDGVYVFLGNGDGTFASPTHLQTCKGSSYHVVHADFNGDGKEDVLANAVRCSGNDGYLSVFLGNGDGTFQPAVSSRAAAQVVITLVPVDLNGDGKADMIVTQKGINAVSVLIGNGDGTFQSVVNYDTPNSDAFLAVGDFNNDKKIDLLESGLSGTFLHLGNGDGTLQPAVQINLSDGPMAVADVNSDQKLDVVQTDDSHAEMIVMQGNGDGTFQQATSYAAGGDVLFPAVADLNGDRAPELLATTITGHSLNVLLNSSGTTLALTSSPNPSMTGQAVTLTVSVSPTFPGVGTPGGTVTFTDQNHSPHKLGTSSLANGQATLTTSALAAGKHKIAVTYSGDSSFNENRGGPLFQVVMP